MFKKNEKNSTWDIFAKMATAFTQHLVTLVLSCDASKTLARHYTVSGKLLESAAIVSVVQRLYACDQEHVLVNADVWFQLLLKFEITEPESCGE